MPFDPSTLCIRTTAGEAELATPAQGLSLSQRRVLTLLQDPVAVEDLAQNHRLEPEKLARDLSRLAALQLIELQGGTIMPAPLNTVPVARADVAESMAPVVIGSTPWRTPKFPLAAGAAVIVLAVGIWYGTRATESTTTALAPPAAAPSPAPPIPPPPASTGNDAARVGAVPVPVTPVAPASPPVQLAIAAPTATVPRTAAATALKAISREAPEFPKEAIADGFKSGIVNARIHVDARGNVAGVDILGAQPPKVFHRATRRALMRWQFEPSAAGQTSDLDVDFNFHRD